MSFRKLIQKAVCSLKTHGIFKSIFWLLFGYVKVNKFYIFMISLDNNLNYAEKTDCALQVKVATHQDISSLKLNPDFQTPEVFISEYLSADKCLIGICNGEPAHIMWIFKKFDDSRMFRLNEGESEINHCFTAERFRGKGIYKNMISKAVNILSKEGIKTCYMATHSTNIHSQKAILSVGFKKIGTIKHYGFCYRPKWVKIKLPELS